MKHIIVTHNRHFHVDEVMAIALLDLYFFTNEKYEIIRTREENILNRYKKDENVFVIDVGFEYNQDMKNFDHHQINMKKNWDNGIPFSSCGLIWTFLRSSKKLHQHMNEETMNLIEKKLIQKIDAQDNGVEKWNDSNFITIYNRKHDDEKIVNKQFERAVSAAKDYFINFFYHLRQDMKSIKEIDKSIKKSKNYTDVVVMESNIKDAPVAVAQKTDKKMVIIPRTKNSWKIQTIPKSVNEPYTKKYPMPKQWCGLKNEQLKKISGIEGLFFCHKEGYMCMFEGSKEKAIELARFIILYNEGEITL